MLPADDPIRFRPRRVLIAGVSGAGKTTFAARLADALGLPRFELDALHHGPEWTPRASFLDEVRAFAATDGWVCEWQYTGKGTDDVLPPRAELCVWLDYPDRIVRARLWRRTLGRSILRRERMPEYEARFAHLTIVRLTHPRDARCWLRSLVPVLPPSSRR